MPLYEYKCHLCGHTIEVLQKFSDEPLKIHEACGGELEKLISRSAFQLKGSGWYATDYAKGNGGAPKSEDSKSADSKSGDSKETKSDSGKSESGASQGKSGESKSDSKAGESKSSDTKSSESKPATAASSSDSKS